MVKVTFTGEGHWAQYPEEKRVYSGGEISVTLRPGESVEVSEKEAERLMADFPGAFVNADDYHPELSLPIEEPSDDTTADAPENPEDPENEDEEKEEDKSTFPGELGGEASDDKPEDE